MSQKLIVSPNVKMLVFSKVPKKVSVPFTFFKLKTTNQFHLLDSTCVIYYPLLHFSKKEIPFVVSPFFNHVCTIALYSLILKFCSVVMFLF
ncbi:hypothetical protein M6B38_342295 [Iris pallida]|uniref:Uncharacterized protein n=1 Tax=Iris pallida TaxID=29817 RepID=A0AAX6GVX7_IRIPA|nr:hypothetical protein M6B38_342295 [Iris pallida]